MRLITTRTPPHFSFRCLACTQRFQTQQGLSGFSSANADLDGKAFEAYYCDPCVVKMCYPEVK